MPKLPKSKKVAWQAKRKPFASNGSKPKYSDNHSFYNSKARTGIEVKERRNESKN